MSHVRRRRRERRIAFDYFYLFICKMRGNNSKTINKVGAQGVVMERTILLKKRKLKNGVVGTCFIIVRFEKGGRGRSLKHSTHAFDSRKCAQKLPPNNWLAEIAGKNRFSETVRNGFQWAPNMDGQQAIFFFCAP